MIKRIRSPKRKNKSKSEVKSQTEVKSPEMQKQIKRGHVKVLGTSRLLLTGPVLQVGWPQRTQTVQPQRTPPGSRCCCHHFERGNFLTRSPRFHFALVPQITSPVPLQ